MSKVTFYERRHGSKISLSANGTVATRNEDADGYGIVFTKEPIPVGKVFRVAVLGREDLIQGAMAIFLTSENPDTSELFGAHRAATFHSPGQEKLIGICSNKIFCNGKPLGRSLSLPESTESLKDGDSVGIRLTQGNRLEVYWNNRRIKILQLSDGPLRPPNTNTQLWGVVDVYGSVVKVKANVCPPPASPPPAACNSDRTRPAASQSPRGRPVRANSVSTASPSPSPADLQRQIEALTRQLEQERVENQVQVDKLRTQLEEKEIANQSKEENLREQLAKEKTEEDQLRRQLARERAASSALSSQIHAERQAMKEETDRKNHEIHTLKQTLQTTRPEPNQQYPISAAQQQRPISRRSFQHQRSCSTISGQDIWHLFF